MLKWGRAGLVNAATQRCVGCESVHTQFYGLKPILHRSALFLVSCAIYQRVALLIGVEGGGKQNSHLNVADTETGNAVSGRGNVCL